MKMCGGAGYDFKSMQLREANLNYLMVNRVMLALEG